MGHSYNTLHLYSECPHKLRCYREKLPAEHPEILQAGSLLHSFFELYTAHCIDQRSQSALSHVQPIFDTAWRVCEGEARKNKQAFLPPLQRAALLVLAREWADTHLIDVDAVAGHEDRLAVAEDLTPVEWFDKGAWFRAVIDLLELPTTDEARVTDYKTGWKVDADPLQPRIYAWLIMSLYPAVERVECVLDYTRFNVQRATAFTRDDLAALDEEVRGLAAAVDADTELKPAPGAACASCPYARHCHASIVQLDGLESQNDAEIEVENIAILERDLAAAKARLRTWCELNGPVNHNGLCWGHHAQGSVGWKSARAFLKAAELDGVPDPISYLTVDGRKQKKLINKRTGLYPAHLGACAINKRTVVFKGKKVAGDDSAAVGAEGEEDAA